MVESGAELAKRMIYGDTVACYSEVSVAPFVKDGVKNVARSAVSRVARLFKRKKVEP